MSQEKRNQSRRGVYCVFFVRVFFTDFKSKFSFNSQCQKGKDEQAKGEMFRSKGVNICLKKRKYLTPKA